MSSSAGNRPAAAARPSPMHSGHMRGFLVGTLTLTVLTLPTGCSDCVESVDCSPATEFEGTTYGFLGRTNLEGVPVGTGEQTGCEDVCGAETGDVEVYELDGFSPEQVIGLRGTDGSFSAAVSLTLTEREQLRIRRQLDQVE